MAGLLLLLTLVTLNAFADEWKEPPIYEEPLKLFSQPPADPPPHVTTTLTVTPRSRTDGWVGITQCHRGLDPFPRVEVVYRYERMRGVRVTTSEGIARAWVEGSSVQLEGVERGATLCVELQASILRPDGAGGFHLHQGPYHRRFLDGWFPLRLTLKIRGGGLRVNSMEPPPQPGLNLHHSARGSTVEALFAGRLELDFHLVE